MVALYLAGVVLANLSVAAFGPWVSILNAGLFIGLDLTTRDVLHQRWRHHLVLRMAGLIAAGGALSWLLNRDAGRIALASTVAFCAAGVVDSVVFHLLRGRSYLVRVNGSNLPSATVDSVIFPAIAFGGFVWWITLGQLVAKVAGGYLWSRILHAAARRKVSEPVT